MGRARSSCMYITIREISQESSFFSTIFFSFYFFVFFSPIVWCLIFHFLRSVVCCMILGGQPSDLDHSAKQRRRIVKAGSCNPLVVQCWGENGPGEFWDLVSSWRAKRSGGIGNVDAGHASFVWIDVDMVVLHDHGKRMDANFMLTLGHPGHADTNNVVGCRVDLLCLFSVIRT